MTSNIDREFGDDLDLGEELPDALAPKKVGRPTKKDQPSAKKERDLGSTFLASALSAPLVPVRRGPR